MLVLTMGILAPLTPLLNILSAVLGFSFRKVGLSQFSTVSKTLFLSLELFDSLGSPVWPRVLLSANSEWFSERLPES